MTTETVEMILNKLGTTIENIVPATVDYMRHGVVVYLCIGIGLFVLGLICGSFFRYLNCYIPNWFK